MSNINMTFWVAGYVVLRGKNKHILYPFYELKEQTQNNKIKSYVLKHNTKHTSQTIHTRNDKKTTMIIH